MQQPEIPKVRAIKRDTSAAPLDQSVSMIVRGTLMYLNLTFMNLYHRTGILIRLLNYLPSINSARYAQPILETVNSRLEAFIHELSIDIVCPSFVHRLYPPLRGEPSENAQLTHEHHSGVKYC